MNVSATDDIKSRLSPSAQSELKAGSAIAAPLVLASMSGPDLSELFEMSPIAYCECSLEGVLTAANDRYCELRGYPLEELRGTRFDGRLHAGASSALLEQAERVLRGEPCEPVEVDLIRGDGKAQSLQMYLGVRRDPMGKPMSIIVASIDHNSSRAAESRFEQLLEASPAGHVEIGLDGIILRANGRAASILGREPQSIPGMYATDLVDSSDAEQLRQVIDDCFDELGSIKRIEARRVLPGIADLWMQLSITAITDQLGQPESLLVSIVDIDDEVRSRKRLVHEATHDPLTDLANRSRLAEELSAAKPGGRTAVLFLDIDRFKRINDRLGHAMGDELLVMLASRIDSVVRANDLVARLGGDEFVVLCRDVEEDKNVLALARRIVDIIEEENFVLGSERVSVTVSIGAAFSDNIAQQPEMILREADMAMYRAKANGRARIEVYDSAVRSQAVGRQRLAQELADGIDRGEIFLDYQPIVELATGRISGVEGLARWQHPEHGLLSPARFIDLAEETGLIVPLGKRVLDEAVRDLSRITQFPDLKIAVNLSPRQLANHNIATTVSAVLDRYGVAAERLTLEITESMLMEDANGSVTTLQGLRDLGIRLAIDDFGTGYSSLSYLRWFPVQTLKIDKSFVQAIEEDDADLLIVKSIIGLADGLGMSTVAEGIESAGQLRKLQEIGCESGQGYFLARPMPFHELVELLESDRCLAHANLGSSA
ncbi:MAG: EAL domain-containing protein [Acidimicrobiales bacterium]